MDLIQTVQSTFDAYQQFSHAHPLTCAMTTAEAFFLTGDLISQKLSGKVNPKKIVYTAVLAPLYGLTMHGIVEAGNNMGDLWNYAIEKGATWNYALTKAALGPNLDGLLFNAIFFLNNKLGERADYNLGRVVQEYGNLTSHPEIKGTGLKGRLKALRKNLNDDRNLPRKEFMQTCLGSLTLWNAFHAVNYAVTPKELCTPFSLLASFGWTCILSYWSTKDLRKARAQEGLCRKSQ
ncbi:MAG: Mpv17/PMP22 family protein [Nanoarchaeota archaeon]